MAVARRRETGCVVVRSRLRRGFELGEKTLQVLLKRTKKKCVNAGETRIPRVDKKQIQTVCFSANSLSSYFFSLELFPWTQRGGRGCRKQEAW